MFQLESHLVSILIEHFSLRAICTCKSCQSKLKDNYRTCNFCSKIWEHVVFLLVCAPFKVVTFSIYVYVYKYSQTEKTI